MNGIVKNLNFGDDARDQVFKGIEKLAKAVCSTLGAGGKCVMLEDSAGKPIITKDGVTVANSIILLDPVENMGSTLLKEAAPISPPKKFDEGAEIKEAKDEIKPSVEKKERKSFLKRIFHKKDKKKEENEQDKKEELNIEKKISVKKKMAPPPPAP